MFCKNCGAEIDDKAVVCPKCGVSTANNKGIAASDDAPSGGFAFLCFLFPILGLILYLVWKDTYPQKAHSCGKGAIIGVIVSVAVVILYFIIVVAAVGCMAASY